ncbi:MAG: DUF167 domain-containing protein [Nanoarchaeota archaeon]
MLIHVKVKPNSSKQKIESFGNNMYLIYLKEPPEKNRANIELINLLARYFTTPPARIKIKAGLNNSKKIIQIE